MYSLDPCKFLRVGDETNGTDVLCLHFNGQNEEGPVLYTVNEGRLTIDFCYLNTIVLW